MVDYTMGSVLWRERSEDERIATVSISINYVQTAREGEIVCVSELDRRNDRMAVLRSEVRHEDGRLIATAIGSYSIFPAERLKDLETGGRAGHRRRRRRLESASTADVAQLVERELPKLEVAGRDPRRPLIGYKPMMRLGGAA